MAANGSRLAVVQPPSIPIAGYKDSPDQRNCLKITVLRSARNLKQENRWRAQSDVVCPLGAIA